MWLLEPQNRDTAEVVAPRYGRAGRIIVTVIEYINTVGAIFYAIRTRLTLGSQIVASIGRILPEPRCCGRYQQSQFMWLDVSRSCYSYILALRGTAGRRFTFNMTSSLLLEKTRGGAYRLPRASQGKGS